MGEGKGAVAFLMLCVGTLAGFVIEHDHMVKFANDEQNKAYSRGYEAAKKDDRIASLEGELKKVKGTEVEEKVEEA